MQVHICVGDISSEDVRQKLINETVKQFGTLDVLVCFLNYFLFIFTLYVPLCTGEQCSTMGFQQLFRVIYGNLRQTHGCECALSYSTDQTGGSSLDSIERQHRQYLVRCGSQSCGLVHVLCHNKSGIEPFHEMSSFGVGTERSACECYQVCMPFYFFQVYAFLLLGFTFSPGYIPDTDVLSRAGVTGEQEKVHFL